MGLVVYTSWKRPEGLPDADWDEGLKNWLRHLKDADVRQSGGLRSAKLFRQCNEEGESRGVYVLLQEYQSRETYASKQASPKDGELHDQAIPRSLSVPGSVKVQYLEPQHTHMWFDYTKQKQAEETASGTPKTRYMEYEYWQLRDDAPRDAYEAIIDTWFRYVVGHKERLFEEWVSARYYRHTDLEWNPGISYAMVFEYASHQEFQIYKKRRRHSYDTNTGDYLVYRDNDPYQFFNEATVGTDGLWPERVDLWILPENR